MKIRFAKFPLVVIGAGILSLCAFSYAYAAEQNASIKLKKDRSSGLFELSIIDPDGIQEFSLKPPSKLPYGGGIDCKRTFSITNVTFDDPSDFTPVMNATVTDCKGNIAEFEITPPVNGMAQGVAVGKQETSEPAKSAPASSGGGGAAAAEPAKDEAPDKNDIVYPVKELGNCASEDACVAYCDDAARADQCIAFAKKYKLVPQEDVAHFEKFKGTKGPGGCASVKSCESYCNSTDHINECIAWAEEHDFFTPEKLAEAKKYQGLIQSGKQFPGGCKDRASCEAYCTEGSHIDECIAFFEENGLVSGEELAEIKKFAPLMKRGETPGGCKGKEVCEKYCSSDDHIDECIAFAEKNDLLSEKDREIIKKTGGRGPGGCRGKAQCEAYCVERGEECMAWAEEHGLMSKEDAERARGGMQRFKEEMGNMPPEVALCMQEAMGGKNTERMQRGEMVFDPHMQEKIQSCMQGLGKDLGIEIREDGSFKGPGGCSSQAECTTFCTENHEDPQCAAMIQKFGGGESVGFEGPGGCRGKEECMKYCEANPKECEGFARPGEGIRMTGEHGGTGPGKEFPQHERAGPDCSPKGTVASFVCAVNGKGARPGAETTYFNECTAQAHGAEILYGDACKGHAPCTTIADPVCGNDGNTWVHACHAEREGGGVQYVGACKSNSSGYQQESQKQNEEYRKQYEEQYRKQYEEQTRQSPPPEFQKQQYEQQYREAPPQYAPQGEQPSPEQQYQQEFQKQYDEQYRQQYEQQTSQYQDQYKQPSQDQLQLQQEPPPAQ